MSFYKTHSDGLTQGRHRAPTPPQWSARSVTAPTPTQVLVDSIKAARGVVPAAAQVVDRSAPVQGSEAVSASAAPVCRFCLDHGIRVEANFEGEDVNGSVPLCARHYNEVGEASACSDPDCDCKRFSETDVELDAPSALDAIAESFNQLRERRK